MIALEQRRRYISIPNQKRINSETTASTSPTKGNPAPPEGGEAAKKGGKESAKRQTERDWESSPKESGE